MEPNPRAQLADDDPRRLARRLVDDLRGVSPAAFRPLGLDIGPAVEQVLFLAIRDAPATDVRRPRSRILRRAAGVAGIVRPGAQVERRDVLVVLLAGVHARLFRPVEAELGARLPGIAIGAATAGRAARHPDLRAVPTIARQAGWGEARALANVGVGARQLREASVRWVDRVGPERAAALRHTAGDALARLAVEAIRLEATVRRARPRVIVTYDEIDAWGRLICAVAAPRGIRVVDLPHAEAVDVEAIRGVTYDAMGVYGPRAARVLEAAGVRSERIAIVGPAGFDALAPAASQSADVPPRVVMAGQYRGRAMTDALRSSILASAVAAADSVDATLEVVPHPTESPSSWEPLVASLPSPPRAIRIVTGAGLHDRLPGAALLVTGWSNSVYEAVLAGVPAVTVHPAAGEPPMPFAAEGIATEVHDRDEAAAAAPRLVAEPGRSAVLARARAALADHLGPLDGHAAARSADLVARLLEG